MLSLGVLLVELITGKDYYREQLDEKSARVPNEIDFQKISMSKDWKKAIKKMLKEQAEKRLDWIEL